MFFRLSFLIFFFNLFLIFSSEKLEQINGKFIYDIDIEENELYILNSKFELKAYNLENLELIYSYKIDNQENFEQRSILNNNLFSSEINLSPDVLEGAMDIFTLKKINNKGFYLFHKGGGFTMKINNNTLERIDNSFPFMNKFFGDFINYNEKIYHFGGYGLFRSNNTMLLFDEENSRQWDEIPYNYLLPNELKNGISSFHSLLVDSDYYILGGNSSFNNNISKNNSILKFNFENFQWTKLGELNLNLTDNPVTINANRSFYIFDKDYFYEIQPLKEKLIRFDYNQDFRIQTIGQNKPFDNNRTFVVSTIKDMESQEDDVEVYFKKTFLYTLKPNNSKYNSSIVYKYNLNDIILVESRTEIPLFKIQQSRNKFFLPILIVMIIIILNLFYVGVKKEASNSKVKLFTFENDELFFENTKITIDNNSLEVLKMLHENEEISSNDIVAKLVDNGLSYDYASKVKNKIIESLNEKFKFITGSEEPFINSSKSDQDKRIQILSLIKS